jgi:hypothetical protein
MNKRQFLGAAALAGAGPALLTATGAIGQPNRGPFDPAPVGAGSHRRAGLRLRGGDQA